MYNINMKKELIIYLGLMGSGKDYEANSLIDKGYVKVAFADPLRSMAWKLLDWRPLSDENYEDFKKGELCLFLPDSNDKYNAFKPLCSGRHLLQQLGQIMREYDSNYWASAWFKYIFSHNLEKVVCTDCRYPNEIRMALEFLNLGYDVKFIYCCYESEKFKQGLKEKHQSEKFAQFLITKNLKHCEVITSDKILELLKEYEG